MVENGDVIITHCLNPHCHVQFLEVQKVGEWLTCDTCNDTLRLTAKPSAKPKEDD